MIYDAESNTFRSFDGGRTREHSHSSNRVLAHRIMTSWALEQENGNRSRAETTSIVSDLLNASMTWSHSEEGHAYWQNIRTILRDMADERDEHDD